MYEKTVFTLRYYNSLQWKTTISMRLSRYKRAILHSYLRSPRVKLQLEMA